MLNCELVKRGGVLVHKEPCGGQVFEDDTGGICIDSLESPSGPRSDDVSFQLADRISCLENDVAAKTDEIEELRQQACTMRQHFCIAEYTRLTRLTSDIIHIAIFSIVRVSFVSCRSKFWHRRWIQRLISCPCFGPFFLMHMQKRQHFYFRSEICWYRPSQRRQFQFMDLKFWQLDYR